MPKYFLPQPQRVRKIECSFAWIDHRLLRNGFLPVMSHHDQEADIAALADQLPRHVLTLPGANAIRAVSLYGETDPISNFPSPDQLVAFAGLDCTVFQTGQYQATRRHIGKRGSPFLRQTLWGMAHVAVRTESPLREFYLRKRRAGLHHLSAVTAVAVKVCRISWRILTDERDYVPLACPARTASLS